jgi:hypothetical protein
MATFFNLELNYGNIYFVTTKEWLCVMCLELHCEVALDDGCDEPGFKVDYPFAGLSYALKYKEHLFHFGESNSTAICLCHLLGIQCNLTLCYPV